MADEIAASSTPAPAASPGVNGNANEGAASPAAPASDGQAASSPVPATTETPAAAPASTEAAPNTPEGTQSTSTDPDPKPADKPADPPAPEAAPSLLTQDKPADKPGEKTAEEPKATEGQSDEPAPLPAYDPFTLPEGTAFDEGRMGDFTKLLGEFENSKPDHEGFQKFGQGLVDFHIAEIGEALKRQEQSYVQSWNQRKTDWVKQFEADPEMGGNRKETSLREAKEFITTHGGSQEHIDAFYEMLKETGAEAHPAMVRFLLNVSNSSSFRTPQQLAANKPADTKLMSKVAKRYGSTT